MNYIDDFLIFGNFGKSNLGFVRLRELLVELGFTISHHKTVSPSQEVVCLGILIDTKIFTMSITPEKLKEISSVVSKWESQKSCTKNQLQSLLCSLLYMSKCVRFARFFLNRMLDTLRRFGSSKTVNLDTDFHRDRIWFKNF